MNQHYTLKQELPDLDEWLNLRRLVGWHVYERTSAQAGLSHSLFGVCAYAKDGTLVGMARVIGDGGTCYYIQDVIVHPDWQGLGIGKAVLGSVMEYILSHAQKGSVVALMSAIGRESFYEKFGFHRRPNHKLGCGMSWIWENE